MPAGEKIINIRISVQIHFFLKCFLKVSSFKQKKTVYIRPKRASHNL